MKKHQIYGILAVAVISALSAGISVSAADKKQQIKQVNFQRMLTQDTLPADAAKEKAVAAQELNIDLRGTVMTAIQNNRDIRISELSLEKAQNAISEAAAGKNPSLDYSFAGKRFKEQDGRTFTTGSDGRIEPVTVSADHGYSNGLNVTWPIWTGGRVEGAIQAARYTAGSAQEDVYLKESDIKLSATSGYYQLLEAIRLEEVNRESVSNLTEHLTNVQQQYQAGIVAKLDVLSSGVSLANAKQNYIAAANARRLAESNLNNIMRIPMSTQLMPVDKDFPQPPFDITMEQAIYVARQNRWELLQAEYNIKIAQENLGVAKAGYMPTVSITGGYTWEDTDFPGFKNEDWSVAGGISWPLFDGGVTMSKVKQAKDDLQIAEETKLKTDETIQLEVRQDYLNIISAREKISATEAAVAEAEEAYKIAVVRYKSGVGINLDVLDAQLQLNTARTNYITALYDYNIGLATLEKAMGVPAVIRN